MMHVTDEVVTISNDSRNHLRAALIAVSVAGLIAGMFAGVSSARTRDGFRITDAHLSFKASIDPPTATRPPFTLGVWSYGECDQDGETYCDVFPIEYAISDPDGANVKFSIQWKDPDGEPDPNFQAKFYNLDDRNPETNAPKEEGTLEANSKDPPRSNEHIKEIIRFPDMRPGNYALALICEGDCAGTKVELEGIAVPVEKYTPPSRYTPPPFTGGPSPTATSSSFGGTGSSAIASPSPVLRPGKDGPARATAIQAVPAGQQAKPPSTRGTTITNIVLLTLIGLILGVGGTIVTLKIRRDLQLKA